MVAMSQAVEGLFIWNLIVIITGPFVELRKTCLVEGVLPNPIIGMAMKQRVVFMG